MGYPNLKMMQDCEKLATVDACDEVEFQLCISSIWLGSRAILLSSRDPIDQINASFMPGDKGFAWPSVCGISNRAVQSGLKKPVV